MIKTRIIKGVVPVVVTPLNKNGSIDNNGLKNLIIFLKTKQIGGFWCLGTGSEDMNLTFKKRVEIAKIISTENADELPLIIGASFFCLEDTFNFIDATKEFQFDAYHIMPYHPKLSLEMLQQYYKLIADYSHKPIWLYTSANWCQYVPPVFVNELMNHPNIAGIKFSSSNTVDQLKVLNFKNEEFQVMTAVANQWFASLAMGSECGTSSLASALPEPLINIYNLFIEGKYDSAREHQLNLIKFTNSLPKSIKKDNFLGGAEEKYILEKRKVCKPFMTNYYRCLNDDEKLVVDKALESCDYLELINNA